MATDNMILPFSAMRRGCLQSGLVLGAAGLAGWPAQEARAEHGMAWGAEPRYPASFEHFDYVNPDAPRGGNLRIGTVDTFDSLNPYILRGVSPRELPILMVESLGVMSLDEPFSVYGLLAKDMELAPDRLSVTFQIREEARFNNGDPVLAEDVRHSFETLTGPKANPYYRQYYGDVDRVEVLGDRTIRFRFKRTNPEIHLTLASDLPIFSRRWGQGKPFDKLSHDPPIVSGPYMLEHMHIGKHIIFRRRKDYWADGLPVRRGMYNFNRLVFKYFRDDAAMLESLKAGDFDWVNELSSGNWLHRHVGRRYRSGELVKRRFPHSNMTGMQGYALNTRRKQFQDVRVRHALALAFDFDWAKRHYYQGMYSRVNSYFSNSTMEASGSPEAEEIRFLKSLSAKPDPVVFGPLQDLPPMDTPAAMRQNLRSARQLFEEAGWYVGSDGVLRNKDGEAFHIEIVEMNGYELLAAPWIHNLKLLGVSVSQRSLDPALYQKRIDTFDFDATTFVFLTGNTPGSELRSILNSENANVEASINYPGIADPVIDEIVERILQVRTRDELQVAVRSLDRVLRHKWYVVPQFQSLTYNIVFNYHLRYPAVLPLIYDPLVWALQTWWYDPSARPVPVPDQSALSGYGADNGVDVSMNPVGADLHEQKTIGRGELC